MITQANIIALNSKARSLRELEQEALREMDRLLLPDPYTIRKQCFENLFENECYVYNRVGHSVFVSEFISQLLHENDPRLFLCEGH